VTIVLAAVVGFLGGRLAWVLLRPALSHALLLRENYRGRTVVTAAGVVLPVTALLVEAGRVIAGAAGVGDAHGTTTARLGTLLAVSVFALVGALDDLVGTGHARGFRGHVAALARGRLTSGGLKLVAGAAVALVAVAPVSARDGALGRLLADAALVALAANLGNLLDRRPGRAIKSGVAAFALVAIAAGLTTVLAAPAVVVGAAVALVLDDLHERAMLGDAGANALGGVIGLSVVLACAPSTRTVVLVVVAGLNVVSELVSFSWVIDAVAPLRALDRAGRLPDDQREMAGPVHGDDTTPR
jgi:hypothetical protein